MPELLEFGHFLYLCRVVRVLTAEAGVGFFLTAAAKIYGVAGPELGIGPRLGAKADLLISPDGVDWSGEVNMTLQAWAGAKVEILGYELAEWSTRFDIAGLTVGQSDFLYGSGRDAFAKPLSARHHK